MTKEKKCFGDLTVGDWFVTYGAMCVILSIDITRKKNSEEIICDLFCLCLDRDTLNQTRKDKMLSIKDSSTFFFRKFNLHFLPDQASYQLTELERLLNS